MANNLRTLGGKQFKQARVHSALCQRIISGAYPPQSALPTRAQLLAEFGVSIVTIQKAMDRLERDGFIHSKWGSGTFVAENPPHLCRYALAFPQTQEWVQHRSSWFSILEQAAATGVRAEPQKQIVSYYNVTGHADVEDYQRLIADAHATRLAGIIFLSVPGFLLNTPLMDNCPVPRVFVGGGDDFLRMNLHSVAPDFDNFLENALSYAAKRSRRRPVLIGPYLGTEIAWQTWSQACRRYGIEPARRQILSLPLGSNDAPRQLTQTLMLLPPEHRPDTLVVAEDHFVEEVTAGLLAMNLAESDLPTVIAHANFPKPPRALVPVTYLGYDSTAIIRTCIDVLDMQRRGQIPPRATRIPAIFASEKTFPDGNAVLSSSNFISAREYAAAEATLHPISERKDS